MQQDNLVILAQKLGSLAVGSRFVRVVAAIVLPFIGVVAAFGIAPDTITEPVPTSRVVQEITLPVARLTDRSDEDYWSEDRVQRGDTLAELLGRLGADDPEAAQALRGARSARALSQLVPGRTVRARTDAEGRLLELRYLNGGNVLSVTREDDSLTVSEEPLQLERRVLMNSGDIRSSLFAATDAAGLPDAVAIQVADIFSTDIDFHRDLRRGDRFSVVYEMYYDQGMPVRAGRVLAAEFINVGRLYRAVWFLMSDGLGGYYTPDGRNIRKAFLRSPLEFSRISSGFSSSRFHPVLRQWRAHKGIDYAAPTGSRVKATGSGVVEFVGRHPGGYGNLVVLRHQSKITTWYGHLSGFANGLRKGGRVNQGEVVGFVGATGLATGPHLHYEFRIDDVHQNPLRVVMPSAPPIEPAEKPAFLAAAAPLTQQLALLRNTTIARRD